MRPTEARWLGEQLAAIEASSLNPVLEIGSSTLSFREQNSHIQHHIHRPLQDRGIRIITTDLKQGAGVDVSGNLLEPAVQARILQYTPNALLCCNVLEHVEERQAFAQACGALLPAGGWLFVSVPHSYPYHLDPIDTYFRPDVEQICELFPDFEVKAAGIVEDQSYWDELRQQGLAGAASELALALARSLLLRGGLERSKARLHRLFWLARPYQIAAAVLRKRG